ARRGEGPSVIETITNRFYGHFEGDPGLIRSKEEVEFIKENKDPLKIFREKVKGKIDEAKLDEIDAASKANVDDAVAKARAAAYPKPEQLLTDVYVSY
ncbi:ABC transporter substrate-binding protein, partial [Acinetobacter baumannii]